MCAPRVVVVIKFSALSFIHGCVIPNMTLYYNCAYCAGYLLFFVGMSYHIFWCICPDFPREELTCVHLYTRRKGTSLPLTPQYRLGRSHIFHDRALDLSFPDFSISRLTTNPVLIHLPHFHISLLQQNKMIICGCDAVQCCNALNHSKYTLEP